ncbi:MAG: hypothetical protein H6618_00925 [Deltaproteobacteria bacterium]|nr:hypothetical protein [Deltaproteobacteria bacterium]
MLSVKHAFIRYQLLLAAFIISVPSLYASYGEQELHQPDIESGFPEISTPEQQHDELSGQLAQIQKHPGYERDVGPKTRELIALLIDLSDQFRQSSAEHRHIVAAGSAPYGTEESESTVADEESGPACKICLRTLREQPPDTNCDHLFHLKCLKRMFQGVLQAGNHEQILVCPVSECNERFRSPLLASLPSSEEELKSFQKMIIRSIAELKFCPDCGEGISCGSPEKIHCDLSALQGNVLLSMRQKASSR